jgi:(1->4)-alpha-D-glucan 1-alpha-D-glucosylmutase
MSSALQDGASGNGMQRYHRGGGSPIAFAVMLMARRHRIAPPHVPCSTYRVQLNAGFTFEDAASIVDYLDDIGITDLYVSPFLMARPGSGHGYDITQHSKLNPDIGTREDFHRMSDELGRHHMGLIADVVPNHMCIDHESNVWWWDVLENGPSSPYARYFDIDWRPPKEDLSGKVLFPILGDQYGRVLEDQQIQARYADGGFHVEVYDKKLPLTPRSWAVILMPALAEVRLRLDPDHVRALELEDVLSAISRLPPIEEANAGRVQEGKQDVEEIRRRIAELMESDDTVRAAVEASLTDLNGVKGEPRTFDRFEDLLGQQAYRLSYWRVAADEINYRRFFDINELAAIRVEDPEVFQAVHKLWFELVHEGRINGLRIDHPDGLLDPAGYFEALQRECRTGDRPMYVVAEKILERNEEWREDWDIEGTVGYEFLNDLNGLFVDYPKRRAFRRVYESFTGWSQPYEDLIYQSKKLILETAMSSELNVLSGKLDRISEQHRWSRDFTLESLRYALRETIACFPIYRTYITGADSRPDPEDERHIRQAIAHARRRNLSTSESIFDFIQSVLLLEDPAELDDAQRAERRLFVMRVQQFTGPVMAKGVEDTAFYRSFALASLNEVGGDPERFGVLPSAFHARNQIALEEWPNTMRATGTHDTKRGEDVRARLNVLSEIPGEWFRAIQQWRSLTRGYLVENAPSPEEEYLIYQTLVGMWDETPGMTDRLVAYMQKAVREAKTRSSWISPNTPYEEAVERYIRGVLSDSRFCCAVRTFVNRIAPAGRCNGLSQVLLKIASPGVPDFYQGSELWDLRLVDPDNRRPVDYDRRRCLLAKARSTPPEELMRCAEDGAVKLLVTERALRFRRANRDLFSEGRYIPLRAAGDRQNHVIAFSRSLGGKAVIAVTGRFFIGLPADPWQTTRLTLRREIAARSFQDVLTGRIIQAEDGEKATLPLHEVLGTLPVALLESM